MLKEDKGRLPRLARSERPTRWGKLSGEDSGCCVALVTPPDPGRLLVSGVLGQRPLQSAALPLRVLSRPVLKHGPRSLTCARVTGILSKPRGAVKAWGSHGIKPLRAAKGGRPVVPERCGRPALPGRLGSGRRRTRSAHVGTRKMVNYARPGRSQGKP